MSITIRTETESDKQTVWKINQTAFGSDDEAKLVDALRDGGYVEVSLVAEVDGEIVGHILFTRITIITKARTVDALSLAPMAVLPSHQWQSIGSKLVEAGLEACREQSHKIVVVLGHPDFYPRFGFSAELARPLGSPFGDGETWMEKELEPGALEDIAGQVKYPPPFGEFK